MLTGAHIENFQSLDSAELTFGKLTVFVGPSSSGKSAVLRALRTLVRNTSSTASVSFGAKSMQLSAQLDQTTVALERGKSLSTYQLQHAGKDEVYTKAGKDVPGEIVQALRMPLVEGEDLNFAFQFDRPFLLSDPPSKSAKVLGDLTNVTTLSEAAREANRRRLEATNKLALRRKDFEALSEQMQPYKDLPAKAKAIQAAHVNLLNFREQIGMSEGLHTLTQELHTVSAALQAAQEQLSITTLPTEQLGALEASVGAMAALRVILVDLLNTARAYQQAKTARTAAEAEEQQAQDAHHELLVQTGTCPTCGTQIAA